MAALVGTLVIVGLALTLILLDDEDKIPAAVSATTSTSVVDTESTTSVAPQTTSSGNPTGSTADCTVVDIRVTANGPLDGIGLRFNPEFEVTTSFLESGGDAILHLNTGYRDEVTDQWVIYSWVSGASLPTPEEAAIPNGTYDPASRAVTGTETVHHLLDFEEVAGSPIAAPFTATYDPTGLVVTGSIVVSDGPHSFTLAAQRIDILDGPGCPPPPEDPTTP